MPLYVFDDDLFPYSSALPVGLRVVELITSPPEYPGDSGFKVTKIYCAKAKRDLKEQRARWEKMHE